jgi:murein DD-endopeptidase MepM/ murein hydrolase activator NlpD
MRLSLPEKTLRDDMVWGFRSGFDDEAYLRSYNSPRWGERFGHADRPVADGRRLDVIVRELCEQFNVSQPLIWAKFIGETSFLSVPIPPGKGYKAPLGFDCPDDGRDPRPEFYGVVPNIRGAVNWWGTFRDRWEWQRRLRDGLERVNVMSEGAAAQFETVRVRTAAEVAYLIYTPHLYSLHDFMGILSREFPWLLKEEGTVGRYVEPIRDMGARTTNLTLHGRSVYRPIDVPGHNAFKGYTTWANNGHVGVGDAVDLAGLAGDEVYAIADGIQTLWQNDMTRKEVIFLEGEGWLAVYAHINAAKEGVNLPVSKGECVGRLRGDLSSPHLHFELWLGGKAVSAPRPGELRDSMRAKLGLTDNVPQPGDPRLIVAKPAAGASSIDGLAYLEVPSRWNHAANIIEADTRALGAWLGKNASGLPDFEHIRVALEHMGVPATCNLTHLHSATDPRVYVFTR